MTFLSLTTLQDNTVDNLFSKIDNLRCENDPDITGDIFFSGDSEDGPCAGSIDRDGIITWLTGEINL
jgi:hypothetical protein